MANKTYQLKKATNKQMSSDKSVKDTRTMMNNSENEQQQVQHDNPEDFGKSPQHQV